MALGYCRGICTREEYKPVKIPGLNPNTFANNAKKCGECERFIRYNGYSCPCCLRKLRTHNRTRNSNSNNRNSKRNRERMINAIAEVPLRYSDNNISNNDANNS